MSSPSRQSVLEAILAATPEPDADDDATTLEARMLTMLAEREPLLAQVQARPTLLPAERAILDHIDERQRRWTSVVERARHELSTRLVGIARLRRSHG